MSGAEGFERRQEIRWGRWVVAAMLVSALTVLYLGRDLTFFSDELGWLTFPGGFSPESLLTPHNGHLIAIPRFVYELLPRVFGAEYLPFRIVALVAFLACVGLFFILARRRVGGAAAIAPTIVLLFFGSASVIVLSPLAIPTTFSIGFGLGALVALDGNGGGGGEGGHNRDLAATGLLILSLLSNSFGGLIAAGAVLFLLRDPRRRRRLWVPLVPLALYGAWWVWAQKFDQGIASLSNLPDVPAFVVESLIANLAALTGFAGPTLGGRFRTLTDIAEVVVIATAIVALIAIAVRLRGRPGGPWLWPFALTLLLFWVGLGLSEDAGREPTTPRYLFFGSIMLLLVVAARARGVRPARRALHVLWAFCALSLVLNVSRLERSADANTAVAEAVQAQLGALQIAGLSADPRFSAALAGPPASKDVAVAAGRYLDFSEEVGSLGSSSSELIGLPGPARSATDFVIARAEGIDLAPAPADSFELFRAGDCRTERGTSQAPALFDLALGETVLELKRASGTALEELRLSRFGPLPGVDIGALEAGRPTRIAIPPDGSDLPWRASVAGTVTVCEAPPAEAR